ncbi:MAG: glycosyltransferase family 9 protein [Halobacteriovoraceae bacterium]|nr:glycosyltransferase family 9 protein [Halobacteriovoraceae bacterium]MCB9094146.1 glycosyltransferase family 9 protein [Halobacteriovoraceae bacterium]
MKIKKLHSLIISRTDAIGDVILTLPLLGLLKKYHPELKIFFLGRSYTRDILELSTHVDQFLDWDEISKLPIKEQVQSLQSLSSESILHVFPRKEIAALASKAKIPFRIGTTNRIYHWLSCNKLVSLSRKNSDLHEAQLNILLAQKAELLPENVEANLEQLKSFYGLKIHATSTPEKAVVLHPGSRGSARIWKIEYFAILAKLLVEKNIPVYITGTQNEGEQFNEYFSSIHSPLFHNMTGKHTVRELVEFISSKSALVASSTGPLHIAAALGVHALGIFPPRRPTHPGRWAPIGEHTTVFVADKPDCHACEGKNVCPCVDAILPEQVLKSLLKKLN